MKMCRWYIFWDNLYITKTTTDRAIHIVHPYQIQAEIDVINASWDVGGASNGLADSIGLMVYEGTQVILFQITMALIILTCNLYGKR